MAYTREEKAMIWLDSFPLDYAKKGDVILVAGKGAEKYQEILGIKHDYNDKDTIMELCAADGDRT